MVDLHQLLLRVQEYQSSHRPALLNLGLKARMETTASALGVDVQEVIRAEQALLSDTVGDSTRALTGATRSLPPVGGQSHGSMPIGPWNVPEVPGSQRPSVPSPTLENARSEVTEMLRPAIGRFRAMVEPLVAAAQAQIRSSRDEVEYVVQQAVDRPRMNAPHGDLGAAVNVDHLTRERDVANAINQRMRGISWTDFVVDRRLAQDLKSLDSVDSIVASVDAERARAVVDSLNRSIGDVPLKVNGVRNPFRVQVLDRGGRLELHIDLDPVKVDAIARAALAATLRELSI